MNLVKVIAQQLFLFLDIPGEIIVRKIRRVDIEQVHCIGHDCAPCPFHQIVGISSEVRLHSREEGQHLPIKLCDLFEVA